MTSERRIILECINLYREFSCLWDNREVLYTNKEARDKAFEVILDKYRQIQDDATIAEVKKKMENMRTAYRREHKKVLMSQRNGDYPYTPQLWYYEHFLFLNDVLEFNLAESTLRGPREGSVKTESDEDSTSMNTPKKRKMTMPTIYLPEQHDSEDEDQDNGSSELLAHLRDSNRPRTTVNVNGVSEAEAFGTTVGLQLKELTQMQRVFAEKLISDIIFYGRLNRLTNGSSLNI